MVLKKDPENLPDDVVDFIDVYSDINTPQYWIASEDGDLIPTLLVLDGHSTIISYVKETEDLHWEAIYELGQYQYAPDSIGDGLIVFPHTFYLEFEIELTDKKLRVNANFDGTGIRAITMPFKDVTIQDFMGSFGDRVASIFTSVLKPADDQLKIQVGESLKIPSSIEMSLSLKLALMGINVQKVKIDEIITLEVKEDDIQEEIFEVPEKKAEKEIEVEEKRAEKVTKITPPPAESPSKPKIPPPKKAPSPPTPGSTTKPPSPGGPPSPGSAPSPSGPPAPGGGGSKSSTPGGPPSPGSAPSPSPRAPSSGGGGPPSPSSAKKRGRSMPPPPSIASETMASEGAMDDIKEAEEEIMDVLSDQDLPMDGKQELLPKGMKMDAQSASSLRQTHITWFDRMIPNRAYKLAVDVSTSYVKAKKSVTNVTTGERRSEVSDSNMVVDVREKLVIRPDFPGCLVVPNQQEFDASDEDINAIFHVTPLAMGVLESKVVFIQNGEEIHHVDLNTKVIKHRVAKWSANLGALVSALPAVFAFFLGKPLNAYMETQLNASVVFASVAGLGYLLPLIVSGVFFAIAGGLYMIQQPKTSNREIAFPR